MKKQHGYWVIIVFLLLTACNHKPQKTVLNISVKDIESPELLFFAPGQLPPDTLQVSTTQPLKVIFDNHEVSAIRMVCAGLFVPLYVEPGQEYNLTFSKNTDGKTVFTSDNNALQEFYKFTTDRNIYKYEFIRDYSVAPLDTVGPKMLDNFKEKIAGDLDIINNIPLSGAMKRALQKDTEIYWLASVSKVIRNDFFRFLQQEKESMYPGYMETWEKIYKEYPISREYLNTHWIEPYAQGYMYLNLFKEYGKELPTYFSTPDENWNLQYNTFYKSIQDKKVLEKVLEKHLYLESLNNKTNDLALTVYIKDFLKEYPENPNSTYFTQYITEVEQYNLLIGQDFSPAVKFVEDYNKLTTLQQAISLFKGKPVFIDFWFSTCGPCISEFKRSEPLKKFLKENGIEMLYISIDSERMEENWKNIIKIYNLEGYHIRAENILHQDMDHTYGVRSFPHYMIINTEGEIVVKNALSPSDGELLINQIKSSLEL